ncbi:hypothetical protein CYFUS_001770 [Cystobacter fuscus]|uniref:Lipoprotein n=1 Tax=Cystobacter fuscus TaxID=43 RepID=A0A250IZL0_9BACT|nr:hypothetical protein [Cystobacter fuscus]ATB36356.1 hypothetical protein CYFUS_001770 [Cystobacter fuscus]
MNRLLVLCVLGSMALLGCEPAGEMLQLIPSPDGTYQAVVLDCRNGPIERMTLIKVVRSGGALDCATRALQQVTLSPGLSPRMVWMSEDSLLIDDRKERTLTFMEIKEGEVSMTFSSWTVLKTPSREQSRGREHLPPAPPSIKTPPFAVRSMSRADVVPEPPIKTPPVAPACGFRGLTLPADFAVLAGGGHGGKRSTVQIDQSGSAATTMTVSVDNPGKPVVLMLGSQEPTLWSIRRSQETTILAVLVSSSYRQIVAGLDATTPVTVLTAENRSECGYFYVDANRLETLNPMAQRFFGRDVDMVYPASGGEVTLGEAKGTPSKWVGGSDAPVESYADKTAPLAGEAGLDDALRKGLLRRANIGDINKWEAQMARVAPGRGATSVSGDGQASRLRSSHMMRNAYVVLRPMTFPAGLYGARSAVFFVPKGTKRPRGNPGHSEVYDFNDMSCTGGPRCHL